MNCETSFYNPISVLITGIYCQDYWKKSRNKGLKFFFQVKNFHLKRMIEQYDSKLSFFITGQTFTTASGCTYCFAIVIFNTFSASVSINRLRCIHSFFSHCISNIKRNQKERWEEKRKIKRAVGQNLFLKWRPHHTY